MSPQLLSNALIIINEKIWTTNNPQSLLNIIPKPEEVDIVMGFIDWSGKQILLLPQKKILSRFQSQWIFWENQSLKLCPY